MRRSWLAITGTPGTGKSTVGRILADRWSVLELSELALATGTATRRHRNVEVDLSDLRGVVRSAPPASRPRVLVGYLSHRLPVQGIVVLRSHPRELERRLTHGRSAASKEEIASNVVAEAVDRILIESLAADVPVWELNTTGRRPEYVARFVERILRGSEPPRSAHVDWLADPRVAAQLLRLGP